MYSTLQKQVSPHTLVIVLVSFILLTITASFLYVLKQPFHDFRQSKQTIELLETEMQSGIPLESQIKLIQGQIVDLNQRLHGNGQKLPINQTIAFVIGQMDKIAVIHDVKLISVEPGEVEKIFLFNELPFHVVVTGTYFSLFDWLNQVESDLGPIVIKEFELTSEPDSVMRRFTITLVSYQFTE